MVAMLALPVSGAAAADSTWTCRASGGYQAQAGEDRVEPVVANGNTNTSTQSPDRAQCADDEARVANRSASGVSQRNAYAVTEVDPDRVQPAAQSIRSFTSSDSTGIVNGGFALSADDVKAEAFASCVGTTPVYSGSSSFNNLRINGQETAPDSTFTELGNGINGSPLGGLIRVTFNEEVRQGDPATSDFTLTRRAIHVTITNATGDVIYESVAGEAKVGRHGQVCVAQSPPGQSCPGDSVFDPKSGICVLTVTVNRDASGRCPAGSQQTESGVCLQAVPVDKSGRPTGGALVPVGLVPGAKKSRCSGKGFGRRVAIMGTSKSDRITGTNKSDRIFVFGGDDFVSAGRGNDCIEGGKGKDRLDGSTGRDYLLGGPGRNLLIGGSSSDHLYGGPSNDRIDGGVGGDVIKGGKGNDKINAGAGNDRVDAGAGRDSITTGSGRKDFVSAGSGVDRINSANAGSPAKVKCGKGRDTVRLNPNEIKRSRSCEQMYVVRYRKKKK